MSKNIQRLLTESEYKSLKVGMELDVRIDLTASTDADTKVIPAISIDDVLRKSGAEGIPKLQRSSSRTVEISMHGGDLKIKAEYQGGMRGSSLGAAYKVVEVNGKPLKPEVSLRYFSSLYAETAQDDPKSKYAASEREIREKIANYGLELHFKQGPVANSKLIRSKIRNGEKAPCFIGVVEVTQLYDRTGV